MSKPKRQHLKDGYLYVKVAPGHHLADCNSYAKRARLIMEARLCRRLRPGEVVHHCDGDPSNDWPDNLMVFPNHAAHRRYHGLIPEPSQTQQIIRAFLRRHGPLTVNEILDMSELRKIKTQNDLQQLKRKGVVKRASQQRWQSSRDWAKRIIVTETGVEHV